MPGCNTALNKRFQHVLPCKCNYTTHATKQRTGLYSGISCDCTHSTVHDTRPTKADIIPPAGRWRAYQRRTRSTDTRYHRHAGTLHRPAQAVYYNNVYKRVRGCACYRSMPDSAADRRPCQPGGVSMLPTPGGLQSGTGSAVRAGSLPPPPGGAVQQQGHGGAARNHWRLSPHLFSGYRPIANRGQQ